MYILLYTFCQLFIDTPFQLSYIYIMKEILRSLRIKNNYSQSAVADYLEISRQMYNKYENGNAEPSIKNIKKLCALYKVSANVFFQEKKEVTYKIKESPALLVSSPTTTYGTSNSKASGNLLNELENLLPLLHLNEKISLLSRLAAIIEKETCASEQPVLKTKKIKKIPDAEYNNYLNSTEAKKIRNAGLATIREMLKDDEW